MASLYRCYRTLQVVGARRGICTDTHYSTIPQPICLHSEAKSIAEALSRHGPNSVRSQNYTLAYESALATFQEELTKVRYVAIRNAKLAIRKSE